MPKFIEPIIGTISLVIFIALVKNQTLPGNLRIILLIFLLGVWGLTIVQLRRRFKSLYLDTVLIANEQERRVHYKKGVCYLDLDFIMNNLGGFYICDEEGNYTLELKDKNLEIQPANQSGNLEGQPVELAYFPFELDKQHYVPAQYFSAFFDETVLEKKDGVYIGRDFSGEEMPEMFKYIFSLWAQAFIYWELQKDYNTKIDFTAKLPVRNESNIEAARSEVWQCWKVASRQSALDLIRWFYDLGYRTHYAPEQLMPDESQSQEPPDFSENPENLEALSVQDLLAWDMASICQLAVEIHACGFISFDECLKLTLPAVNRTRHSFSDWLEFARHYREGFKYCLPLALDIPADQVNANDQAYKYFIREYRRACPPWELPPDVDYQQTDPDWDEFFPEDSPYHQAVSLDLERLQTLKQSIFEEGNPMFDYLTAVEGHLADPELNDKADNCAAYMSDYADSLLLCPSIGHVLNRITIAASQIDRADKRWRLTLEELRWCYGFLSDCAEAAGLDNENGTGYGRYVTLRINARLQSLDRAKWYEEPLDQALRAAECGNTDGGGTFMNPNGELRYCEVQIILAEDSDECYQRMLDILLGFAMPKDSSVHRGNVKRKIGELEGLALYLNGGELADEVYELYDVNFVIAELDKRLGEAGKFYSHWPGPDEMALYFYGPSFEEMKRIIEPFAAEYPLCEKSRIVTIA